MDMNASDLVGELHRVCVDGHAFCSPSVTDGGAFIIVRVCVWMTETHIVLYVLI